MNKLFLILLLIFLFSCTDNKRTKLFGGKTEIVLNKNEKFLNITWKDASMWVLTEDTLTHVKYFREHSNYGFLEGEVVIK